MEKYVVGYYYFSSPQGKYPAKVWKKTPPQMFVHVE